MNPLNPRASTELQAEELIDAIEQVLAQSPPDPVDLIAFMQLSHEVSMALAGLGAMSHGRRISVNDLIERLQQLHRALAVQLTKIVGTLVVMAAQTVPASVQPPPSGAASLFKL